MSSYAIKLDLKKLNRTGLVNVKGKRCVLIPVDDNKEIFVGGKGIYLNLNCIELKTPSQFGDTHLVKGNLDRDAYNALTEEERKALPILGNARPFERKQSEQPGVTIADADIAPVDDYDDLPF